MVTLNTQVRVQTKTGAALSTVTLDSFWASMGNPNAFDPKVLYDASANRWMFTAMADAQAAGSAILIGVSQTSDPTGQWNLYRIDADASNQNWADYPSIGFNKDWIVVSVNMFTVANNNFTRSEIYVFDKADLYARGVGRFTRFQDANAFTQAPAITHDNIISTMYLLEDFSLFNSGQLRLSTITGPVGSEVYNPGVSFPAGTNAWQFFSPDDFAPQLGAGRGIMNNDSRIQNLVYRNNALWAAHTVFLPGSGSPARSAVQWWQINPTNGVPIQFARIEDTTGQQFFAFPSIAVNQFSDVLIGYSRFAATQFASANYSFRAGTDTLNTMRPDRVLKAGEAPYVKTFSGTRNRWGDYSSTVVDPVNDSDMWTIQEFAATPSGGFDRWGTWWGRVVPQQLPSLTITDRVVLAEGNSGVTNAVFTLSLSASSTNTVSVDYAVTNGTATVGSDLFPSSGTLTFPPGTISRTISVPVFGDTIIEQNETFFVQISNPMSTSLVTNQALGVILNDDGPVLLISDITVTEGDLGVTNAVFNVTLTQPAVVSVPFFATNLTASAGTDYQSTNGVLFFSGGLTNTNQTITIPVFGDLFLESNETFHVLLTNASGATIFRNAGLGTIADDESLISVLDTTVVEGNSGTTAAVFTVTLQKPITNTVTVNYAASSSSAGVGTDFAATSGLLNFAPGVTNLTITVPVFGDTLSESNEVFFLSLSNPTNTFIIRNHASCVITNDDALPGVFITNAVQFTEGNSAASSVDVTVFLTSASGQIVQVAYATAVGTASPGSDYVASSGILVFPTNTTSRVISIPIMGDSNYEGNETFTVRISNPSNATNVTSQGISTVTIVDDDPVPLIGVSDVSLFEGNSGTTTAVFTVTLSVSSGLPVTVNYATSDLSPATGAAVGGTDYVSASGTVTFPPGSTSQTVSITVNSDVLEEPNESFFLDLSGAANAIIARNRGFGTILNDDGPILQISDVTLVEGNSGTTNAIFTVTLLPADDGTVTVLYATSNMTATAGLDYLATNGSLSFAPGQTSTNLTVVVNGETFLESDETFAVVLSSATNATIGRAVGAGTIKDDDTLADLELAVTRSSLVGSGLTNFVGHHLTYFITVTNRGPLPSTNVVVTNLLPASFAIVSWTNSQGTFSGGSGSAVFSVGTLVSNAGFAASLVVAPSTTGSLTNFVSVLGQQPDPNPLNNTTNLPSDIILPQVTLTGGASLSLVAEGVQPPNGSFDAAEFVTVALTLQNLGNVAATNVSVSLLSGTGVHAPSGAQSYGPLTTNLPTARQFNFTANTAGGDVITTFVITDGTNSMGTVSFTNRTGSSSASANAASVSIPAFGAAATYPSVINVSGLAGVVNKVSVTLSNLSHSWPADLDILLVGPAGQSALLLSDAGGGNNPVSGVALTFDDAAASPVVEFGPIAAGAYKPSNYDASDSFPAPAPAAPYGSQLSVFNGTDPNGAWSLFVVDDANGDLGSLAGGWSLRIETAAPVNTTAALAVSLSATPDPVRVGSNLVYTITVTNRGPGAATSVVLSNILPFQAVLVAAPAFTQGTVITNSEGVLVASLGKILSGASVDGVISVINQAAGTATNIVTVAGNETDANLADNAAVNVTRINRVVALASQSATTLTNGQFGLTLTGSAGLTYVIEVSTNLVHWTPIFTNPPGGGTVNFVDTNAAAGLRFYRAVER